MRTLNASVMKAVLSATAAASLLLVGMTAQAETKFTVGVGHMCCAGCEMATKAALEKLAGNVAIDGKMVTVTLKENDTDILPSLEALRKAGFPPTRIDAGSGPVTLGVAHLCCGGCNASLKDALTSAKIDELDTDSLKIADGSLIVKAKEGKTLDLAPVLAAMEKGGFEPSKITLGAAAKPAPKPKASPAAH